MRKFLTFFGTRSLDFFSFFHLKKVEATVGRKSCEVVGKNKGCNFCSRLFSQRGWEEKVGRNSLVSSFLSQLPVISAECLEQKKEGKKNRNRPRLNFPSLINFLHKSSF